MNKLSKLLAAGVIAASTPLVSCNYDEKFLSCQSQDDKTFYIPQSDLEKYRSYILKMTENGNNKSSDERMEDVIKEISDLAKKVFVISKKFNNPNQIDSLEKTGALLFKYYPDRHEFYRK